MLTIADENDIKRHFADVQKAGMIPPQLKLNGVKFTLGGGIDIDGAFDLPWPIGGFSVDLQLVVKLLADKKTVRIRLVNVEALDLGVRPIVMKVIDRIADQFTIPNLRTVRDKGDIYWEYTPMPWIELEDILTQDNRLTVVINRINVPLVAETAKQAQAAQFAKENPMAGTLKNPTGSATSNAAPANERSTPNPAPNLADGKVTMSVKQ